VVAAVVVVAAYVAPVHVTAVVLDVAVVDADAFALIRRQPVVQWLHLDVAVAVVDADVFAMIRRQPVVQWLQLFLGLVAMKRNLSLAAELHHGTETMLVGLPGEAHRSAVVAVAREFGLSELLVAVLVRRIVTQRTTLPHMMIGLSSRFVWQLLAST